MKPKELLKNGCLFRRSSYMYILQLKIIQVFSFIKAKKIDISIPKLGTFIHRYIVILQEKSIKPFIYLTHLRCINLSKL